jgi:hypothetical protein
MQNSLTSELYRLTLFSAIALLIEAVEAALDQILYTTLAQGGNQFHTVSMKQPLNHALYCSR